MIDWNEQWALFAPHFKEGIAHIDLGSSYPPVKLFAGSGFGDGSHPTTKLMLKAMPPHIPGNTVVDIGCGTGILSYAAAHMGAKKVYGIDIEQEAIAHAEKNRSLNPPPHPLYFSLQPPVLQEDLIILMNMIPAEQQLAWKAAKHLQPYAKAILVSGILKEKRDEYLKWAATQGWLLKGEAASDPWLQLTFS